MTLFLYESKFNKTHNDSEAVTQTVTYNKSQQTRGTEI